MKRRGRLLYLADDNIWQWKLVKHKLIIWDPQDSKYVVSLDVFTGIDWPNLEDLEDNRGLRIGPRDVRVWVETHDLSKLCPGSGKEQVPELVKGSVCEWRQFRPDQLVCPDCGDRISPVGWAYPDHYPLKKGA